MSTLLWIIGVVVLIIGVISGISAGGFLGFFVGLIGGLVGAIIYFALAVIIDNQEAMRIQIQAIYDLSRKVVVSKTCEKCKQDYEGDRTSCPHCGAKPGKLFKDTANHE